MAEVQCPNHRAATGQQFCWILGRIMLNWLNEWIKLAFVTVAVHTPNGGGHSAILVWGGRLRLPFCGVVGGRVSPWGLALAVAASFSVQAW